MSLQNIENRNQLIRKPSSYSAIQWLKTQFQRNEQALLGWATLLFFLALWELVPALGLVKPLFTSSPSRIINAGAWLFAHGFWNDIGVSALEFVCGFSLSLLVGAPLGIFLGWHIRLRAMFNPLLSALNATPRVALLPLLILWLGIGIESKIAIVLLGAIFPIVMNVMAGMRTLDEQLLRCARSFGATDRQILLTIALPSTLPFLIAGIRLAVGRALIGVVVGELVASTAGIGHMMAMASASFQTDKVFVGVMILAATGYGLTELLSRAEAHFERWRPR